MLYFFFLQYILQNMDKTLKLLFQDLKYKPIIIGGRALEFYKIRKGHDYDFIIHASDHERISKSLGSDDLGKIYVEPGIDLFIKIYNISYETLKAKAIDAKKFYVISLDDLILLKLYMSEDSSAPIDFRKKAKKDLELIAKKKIKRNW